MTFAQPRNRLTTHFSENIRVVKRRISVHLFSRYAEKDARRAAKCETPQNLNKISSPFRTSATKQLINALFWVITQRVVVISYVI